jgi:glycosyltransferase involved in cell wall biosynthesis
MIFKKEYNTVKIVCFENAVAYTVYKEGIYPSHFLYGAIELEKAGFNVVFLSRSQNTNQILRLFENARMILMESPDAIFIPFITKDESLVCLLKMLHITRIPIFGYAHRTIRCKKRYNLLGKLYYNSYNKIFFISQKTIDESIRSKIISDKQAILVPWGSDLSYYDRIISKNSKKDNYFISNGKENRDFKILIDSFKRTDSNLKIITASNGGRSYEFLNSYSGNYSNIEVNLSKNSANLTLHLAEISALSYCIVIPLLQSEINYCVGLSSLVEALALGKPIITTDNPYYPFDVEKEGVGIKVKDTISWIDAINYLKNNAKNAHQMGEKARELGEKKYNIENAATLIIDIIQKIVLRKKGKC